MTSDLSATADNETKVIYDFLNRKIYFLEVVKIRNKLIWMLRKVKSKPSRVELDEFQKIFKYENT